MADELVLHYQDTNVMLGSRKRMNRAIAVAAGLVVVFGGARLAAGGSLGGYYALIAAGLSALVLVFLLYARLRWANAGLFLAGGVVGVIGTLGERSRVEVSRLDHFQLCTLAVTSTSPYGVLLFVDREGRAILRLNTAQLLPAEGLRELSRRSGLPIRGSFEDTYNAAEMAKRFPGSVARGTGISAGMLQNRGRTQLITAGVTVLGFVALFLVLLARSGH
jgi:hypothetical protein